MEIYTSYFAKANKLREFGIIPISISLYPPKGWNGSQIKNLAPLRYMLMKNVSEEQYISLYNNHILSTLDAKGFIEMLRRNFGEQDIALCCYESPEKFCHRQLVSKWIKEEAGIEVKEYDFSSGYKEKNKIEQLGLF